MAYRILIVDDFLMSRQVFENAVAGNPDYEVIASVENTEEALTFINWHYADLVIMDVVMRAGMNGLEAARRIKEIRPETKIIIVTSMPEVSYIERAKQIGVESFWYKDVQEQPILEIIERTMAGERIYPDAAPVVNLGDAVSTEFTGRELDVLRELTGGLSNQEIAEKLNLSDRTVKMHISRMLQKTGFRTRLELAVKARTGGLVIPDQE